MTKIIDLNKSVYDLTEAYPEIIDVMKEIGFPEITQEAMRKSMGRIMTIPKGAMAKGIDIETIKDAFRSKGFRILGDEKETVKQVQENVSSGERIDLLKGYLRRLGKGEDLETVREDFVLNFKDVEASEIMKAEQDLIKEGTPITEVQRLCDLHSALFHGATKEERIAQADQAVLESVNRMLKEKGLTNPANFERFKDPDTKMAKTRELAAIPGHPLGHFDRINRALEKALDKAKAALKKKDISNELFEKIRSIVPHYAKKGDLLYPLLSVKYDITGPSNVMWTVDDEIRDELSALSKLETRDQAWYERYEKVLARVEEMIYKEDNILYPICAENFTHEEWMDIYEEAKEYTDSLSVSAENWQEAEERIQNKPRTIAFENGEVVMPGGHMRLDQLTAMLNTVPIEITYVDENNINRYFNEGPKVFKRPGMAIDRNVENCHPPKVAVITKTIIDDFKNNKRDVVPVWLEKEGRPFYVQYMAVRDADGKYLGTVEVVQDMTFAKDHFAGKK